MSYILEALRKSERERAQGNVPTLETVSRDDAGHGLLWRGAGIGVAILLLLAAVVWLVNVQYFRDPALPGDGVKGTGSTKAPDSEPLAAAEREPAPVDAGRNIPRRVVDISGLNDAARQRIEGLSVNVVSYSEVPERRFVMLNQRIVRESEALGDGVFVKRITPDGALLSAGDYEIMIEPD